MPDQTVTVTFNPAAEPPFTFSPDPVTMTSAGRIIINRAGGSTWTFVNATISNGGTQFSSAPNNAGTSINVQDAYTSMGRFCYVVTVQMGGTSYTSPDPEIVNEPPTPVPTPKPPKH